MRKTTLLYIVLLIVLCVGSYGLGAKHRKEAIIESTETKVEVDSTIFYTPKPPIVVRPTDDKVIDRLPVVNYVTLKAQIIDSLIAAGWCVQNTHIPDIDNILPDSIYVEVPLSQSVFKEDGKFEIGVTGYNTTLDYAKIFNTTTTMTTTLRQPTKHWSVNASINSFTGQRLTNVSAGLGIDYTVNRWKFGGGYQVFMNGNSGVTFRIERKILEF